MTAWTTSLDQVLSYHPGLHPTALTCSQSTLIMANKAVIPFLVAMMLLTGVCNTLLTKYQVCLQKCHHDILGLTVCRISNVFAIATLQTIKTSSGSHNPSYKREIFFSMLFCLLLIRRQCPDVHRRDGLLDCSWRLCDLQALFRQGRSVISRWLPTCQRGRWYAFRR